MKFEFLFPFAVGILLLVDILTRKRRNVAAMLGFGRERKWEMLLIERCLSPRLIQSRNAMTYNARYRNHEGKIHESILEVGWLGGVSLLEDEQLSRKLVRKMSNRKLRMDCRQCGSQLQVGMERCPYCRSWRNAFKPG